MAEALMKDFNLPRDCSAGVFQIKSELIRDIFHSPYNLYTDPEAAEMSDGARVEYQGSMGQIIHIHRSMIGSCRRVVGGRCAAQSQIRSVGGADMWTAQNTEPRGKPTRAASTTYREKVTLVWHPDPKNYVSSTTDCTMETNQTIRHQLLNNSLLLGQF